MSKVKHRDIKYINDPNSFQFTTYDLERYSGIKIKNSNTECYLKRIDENGNKYWVKCMKGQKNKIIEIEIVTVEQLLERLNSDKQNYILI